MLMRERRRHRVELQQHGEQRQLPDDAMSSHLCGGASEML
jgi:hypothetical protein